MKKRIVIIGAGLGGLAAGCRLAALGHNVEILEKRPLVGGLAAPLQVSDFTVDAGPSAFTAPHLLDDIYRTARRSRPATLQFTPVSPAYRIFDAQQRFFNLYFDPQRLQEEVTRWHPAAADAFLQYQRDTRPLLSPRFVSLAHPPLLNPVSILKTLPDLIRLKGLQNTWAYLSAYFEEPFLRAVFSLKPFLMGSNPLQVNIFTTLHMQQQDKNMVHISGGTAAIVRHLANLFQELGGKISCNAEVVEILSHFRRVSGVRTKDGGLLPADIILSNADVADTYHRLASKHHRGRFTQKNNPRQHFSMSMFAIHLVTSRRYLDSPLAHHNVILPHDYPGLLEKIFTHKVLAEEPALFVHMPTRTEAALAPEGHEILAIYVPVPNLSAALDWTTQARPFREKVLASLETRFLPELRASIVAEKIITPPDWHSNFNASFGAPFSLQSSPWQAGWFRPPNRSRNFDNLYLVGAGTHPGPGISAVLASAQIIERLIGPA